MIKAAIGFRAKTGRAIAVVLAADSSEPSFVWRGELDLVESTASESLAPYHQVMHLPWPEALVAVQPLVMEIEAVAHAALKKLVIDMRERDFDIRSVGVVGSPPKNLEKIGNYHIRAHAAEGTLFRRVLEAAAGKLKLTCRGYSEGEIKGAAPESAMTRIGRSAGRPWRADERLAASAAWVALR
jgi:hypothetical protein